MVNESTFFAGSYEDAIAANVTQRTYLCNGVMYSTIQNQYCNDINECAVNNGRCHKHSECINTIVICSSVVNVTKQLSEIYSKD